MVRCWIHTGSTQSYFEHPCMVCFPTGKCVHADMEESWETRCDNLLMCFVTILTRGVPAGGGVGDILRKVGSSVSTHPTGVLEVDGGGGGRYMPWNRAVGATFEWGAEGCHI